MQPNLRCALFAPSAYNRACLVLTALVVTAVTSCCAVLCAVSIRAALIGGSGLSRKLLETARNFPNVAVYIDSDVLQVRGCVVRAEGQQGLQPCSEWYAVVTGPVLAFCQGCAKWGWDGLAQCFCAGKLRVLLHRPQHRFCGTSQSLPRSAPFVDSRGSFRPSVRPQQAVSTSAPPCMCCCVSAGAWRHGARAAWLCDG